MTENRQKVFNRLYLDGIMLKQKKCTLLEHKGDYLGHVISLSRVATDPKKKDTIKECIGPTTVKKDRAFLKLCSCNGRFVKDFGLIAKPLHKLTNKDVKFKWTDQCHAKWRSV